MIHIYTIPITFLLFTKQGNNMMFELAWKLHKPSHRAVLFMDILSQEYTIYICLFTV